MLFEELQIRNVRIHPAHILAPMAGITDTVFRRFIKRLGGCGLIMTEFVSSEAMVRQNLRSRRYLYYTEEERPITAQIFGADPDHLADAARMIEDLGFDIVDLNLGCPAKKVVKCGGSGLLRDLPQLKTIFQKIRAAVSIPFTTKIRSGWSDEEIVALEVARLAEDSGVEAIAIHPRTRLQGYSGRARWDIIAEVKNNVRIPVIGNGDVMAPEDALALRQQTGCDAVMIGRAAPTNPWIFRQMESFARTGALSAAFRRRPLSADPRLLCHAGCGRNARGHRKDEAVRQLVYPRRQKRSRTAPQRPERPKPPGSAGPRRRFLWKDIVPAAPDAHIAVSAMPHHESV